MLYKCLQLVLEHGNLKVNEIVTFMPHVYSTNSRSRSPLEESYCRHVYVQSIVQFLLWAICSSLLKQVDWTILNFCLHPYSLVIIYSGPQKKSK